MGVTRRIDGNLVEIVISGRFSAEELLGGFRSMLDDEHLPNHAYVLIDVTESELIPQIDIMDRIASILCEGREKLASRMAILVAHTVRYGKARQLGTLLERGNILAEPFYERESAVEWLQRTDM